MVNLNVVKSADRAYVFCGISNRVKYSIIITNTGTTKAMCVKVRDLLGKGARFLDGTLTINGCRQNVLGIDYSISVGSIPPGGNAIVTFDAAVACFSNIGSIMNQAIVSYCEDGNIIEVVSNILVLPVININVCIQKTVDKCEVLIGEILSYSIMIRNDSNIPIENVILYDDLSPSLEVLPASVTVNGIPQFIGDLSLGLNLGNLASQASVIVSFQAEVISYPSGGVLTNCARVEYEYTILQNDIPTTSIGESCSNVAMTKVSNNTVKC